MPVGRGRTDWAAVPRAVQDTGYGGIYVIEPAYRSFMDDALPELERCREFVERMA